MILFKDSEISLLTLTSIHNKKDLIAICPMVIYTYLY